MSAELEKRIKDLEMANDHLRSTRPRVTTEWLLGLGFKNIGSREWPILESPPSNFGGPVCRLCVDSMMGCDGWTIGYGSDVKTKDGTYSTGTMISPPNTKQEAMLLFMGLGLDLPLFREEP